MSSRLNPRDYDLEELRTAFQANRGEKDSGGSDLLEQHHARETDTSGSAIEQEEGWLPADDKSQQRTNEPMKNATDGGQPEGIREQASGGRLEATDSVRDVDREQSQVTARPCDGSKDGDLLPLTQLPNTYTAQQEVLDWMEELLSWSGYQGTMEALRYYESIGWLSTECHDQLEDFADGLQAAGSMDPRPLDVDDHRQSLQYIATLARCR